MSNEEHTKEARALHDIIAVLAELDDAPRVRLLDTVARFFDITPTGRAGGRQSPTLVPEEQSYANTTPSHIYISGETLTPKSFLIEKAPRTLVERVACLAYFLTHYRDTPHFKTFDISQLNTEAAQTKFSNTAQSVADATRAGLLAAAGKGNKQLSAIGEEYVKALPDQDAARAALKRLKPKKQRKNSAGQKKRPQK